MAIFAKIASLQGATFGIQFKSPAAGDFSPVSPFSPLHAFLDISVVSPSTDVGVLNFRGGNLGIKYFFLAVLRLKKRLSVYSAVFV